LVSAWIEQFAPDRRIAAVLVEEGQQAVAALPLVEQRWGQFVLVGGLPANEWATHGDLLWDPRVGPAAIEALIEALGRRLPWPLVSLSPVALEAPQWAAFFEAAARVGWSLHRQTRWRTGVVDVQGSWADYESALGRDHRRNRRRNSQALDKAGGGELDLRTEFTAAEVSRLVREGFEVEDRSWKGAAGTSVLRTPGMFEFFERSALSAAALGCLELAFLRHAGRPIAFGYGWQAKDTHFLPKVGYDEGFKQFGPGQLLVMRWLERLFAGGRRQTLDFWGELAPWTESWSTRSYAVGRIVAAGPSRLGRSLVYAYENWRPRLKRLRDYWLGQAPAGVSGNE
jgi:hypothetical protein